MQPKTAFLGYFWVISDHPMQTRVSIANKSKLYSKHYICMAQNTNKAYCIHLYSTVYSLKLPCWAIFGLFLAVQCNQLEEPQIANKSKFYSKHYICMAQNTNTACRKLQTSIVCTRIAPCVQPGIALWGYFCSGLFLAMPCMKQVSQ